jgi:hypothetical protein
LFSLSFVHIYANEFAGTRQQIFFFFFL